MNERYAQMVCHRCKKIIAVCMLSVFFWACILAEGSGKYLGYLPRTVSAQASETLTERDSVELYDGAAGDIEVSMVNVPDLYFTPDEDGAWKLLLTTQEIEGVQYIHFDWCDFYEKQSDGSWELISWGIDEQRGYPSVFGCNRRDVIVSQYFQKGKTYKIHFEPTESGGTTPAQYQYSFLKTDEAGCYDGWIWRMERDSVFCYRYIGDETVLHVPDTINNYPVKHITMGYSVANQQLQKIFVGESVCVIGLFSQCQNLKDVYIYNGDCDMRSSLPGKWDEHTGEYYWDTVTHSYAGGEVERICRERNYPFEALAPTPTPEVTIVPTEKPKPTAIPTATPIPELTSSPTPTGHPTGSPSPAVTVVPTPVPTLSPSQAPTEKPVPTRVASTATPPQTKQSSPPQSPAVISGFRLTTDNYTMVNLKWKGLSGMSYRICRSTSPTSGFRVIKKGITQTSYRDNSVQSGKCYYYRIQAVKEGKGSQMLQAQSQVVQIKIRALARPIIKVKKKQANGIRYLLIRVKKYEGERLEVYYRNSKWASCRKVRLNTNHIKRQRGTFRIQYMSTRKILYIKMRTYAKKRGKKIYSPYTKEKKIRV